MPAHDTPTTLPEVTDAHRRAAFTLMSWPDCSFEQAMANDLRRRVIEACAHVLRKREWQQQRRGAWRLAQPVRPAAPGRWLALRAPPGIDLKRAAAGDVDRNDDDDEEERDHAGADD